MAAERDANLKIALKVEKFPCLYNFKRSDYSRKDVTEKAWCAISKETKFSVQECKEKWKNIRSAFVRSLKPAPSGSAAKSKKPYYLYDNLLFILPYVKPVNTSESPGNIESPPHTSETQESLQEEEAASNNDEEVFLNDNPQSEDSVPRISNTPKDPQPIRPIKRKRNVQDNLDKSFLEYLENKKQKTTPSDKETATKYFLLSLLPDVKTLTDDQMRKFKVDVLLLIEKIKSGQPGPSTVPTPLSSTGSNSYPYSSSRSASQLSQHAFEEEHTNQMGSRNNQQYTNLYSNISTDTSDTSMASPRNEYEQEQQSHGEGAFWDIYTSRT